MRHSWGAVAGIVLLVAGCSSLPAGDREACAEFVTSADTVREFQEALVGGDESAASGYRLASGDHGERMIEASAIAETTALRDRLTDGAALWGRSGDDSDAGVAYYMLEDEIRDFCS